MKAISFANLRSFRSSIMTALDSASMQRIERYPKVSAWIKRYLKTIVNYMGHPRLLLAPMFLLLLVIRDISHSPYQ